MRLSEYRDAVEQLEGGKYPSYFDDTRSVGDETSDFCLARAANFLADEISGCLWQAWAKSEALELAGRARIVADSAFQFGKHSVMSKD